MSKKFNGYAKLVLAMAAVATLVFNTLLAYSNRVATTALINNEIKHLQEDVSEIKIDVSAIQKYLLEHK